MDMVFIRRAERLLTPERPAPLDHGMLVAALAAERSAALRPSPPSAAAARREEADEPLVELLVGGPRWRQALSAQRGCFNRAVAGRRLNGS